MPTTATVTVEQRQVWTFASAVASHLAMWAIRQSPYDWPDNLEAALASFRAAFPGDERGMSKWPSEDALEAAIWSAIEASPEIVGWNTPKSGHDLPFVFSSRYDKPAADDDFIDLHALSRNVARTLWAEETEGFDTERNALEGQP